MFGGNMVFVLGAGASADAGLPVGSTLKSHISNVLHIFSVGLEGSDKRSVVGDEKITDAFRRYCDANEGLSEHHFYSAAAHISGAMRLAKSIDHFLHSHRGNETIEVCGKMAIARTILNAEGSDVQSKLLPPRSGGGRLELNRLDGTWYLLFAELLCACTLDELPERLSRMSFVVFNYDRCLEQFLLWAFMIYFNLHEHEAAKIVNRVQIWHPYGKVGKLPWQDERGVSVPFGGADYDVAKVAQSLRTFTETFEEDDAEVEKARASITEAGLVVFLGCAYHELNLKLIRPKDARKQDGESKVFFGTTYGLAAPNRHVAENRVSAFYPDGTSMVVHMPENLDCAGLFRDYFYAFDR